MEGLLSLFSNITNLDYKQVIMWVIGAVLIYLAIKRKNGANAASSNRFRYHTC